MAYKYNGVAPEPPKLDTPLCGTRSGYTRHFQLGTQRCQPCKTAHNKYMYNYRRPKRRQVCATYAGYMRHKRAGEASCKLCLTAYADYMHQYRARRKAAA